MCLITLLFLIAALWLGILFGGVYLLATVLGWIIPSDSKYADAIGGISSISFALTYLYALLWFCNRIDGGM